MRRGAACVDEARFGVVEQQYLHNEKKSAHAQQKHMRYRNEGCATTLLYPLERSHNPHHRNAAPLSLTAVSIPRILFS